MLPVERARQLPGRIHGSIYFLFEHRARIAEEKEQEEAHATARNAMYELEDAADLDEAREEAKVDAATGDVSTPNTLCSPSCLSVAR